MVDQLYPQALGSLFIASYDSQGYCGDVRTRLYIGMTHWLLSVFNIYMTYRDGPKKELYV
jgi:hypothetical protein